MIHFFIKEASYMKNKPVCYVPGIKNPEIYSGTPTFMGLPKIQAKAELPGHDVVFLGVPWEGICTWGNYTMCEMATKTIRTASVRYSGFLPELDIDIFDHLSGGDYGDTAVRNGDYDFTFAAMGQRYGEILDAGCFPVVFGGDHSITYPLMKEQVSRKPGKIGLIHFDAHMDNMDTFGEEKLARCCPMHRIYEMEGFDPTKMVTLGIRGPRNHYGALAEAKKYGVRVMTMMDIRRMGYMEAIQKAIAIASEGTEGFYVTVCSDALDVAFNPAGAPDPCGLTTWELGMMLHQCGLNGACALDYVEIYYGADPGMLSSHNAVWMSLYLLAGVAQRRTGK